MKRLLMEPGSALLIIAVTAFLARFVLKSLPFVGGLLSFTLMLVALFGLVGGVVVIAKTRFGTAA